MIRARDSSPERFGRGAVPNVPRLSPVQGLSPVQSSRFKSSTFQSRSPFQSFQTFQKFTLSSIEGFNSGASTFLRGAQDSRLVQNVELRTRARITSTFFGILKTSKQNNGSDHTMSQCCRRFSPRGWRYKALMCHFRCQNHPRKLHREHRVRAQLAEKQRSTLSLVESVYICFNERNCGGTLSARNKGPER